MITVRTATFDATGASVQLQIAGAASAASDARCLASAIYRLAARFEDMADTEALGYDVDVRAARVGIIRLDWSTKSERVAEDCFAMANDLIAEVCCECGFEPSAVSK